MRRSECQVPERQPRGFNPLEVIIDYAQMWDMEAAFSSGAPTVGAVLKVLLKARMEAGVTNNQDIIRNAWESGQSEIMRTINAHTPHA